MINILLITNLLWAQFLPNVQPPPKNQFVMPNHAQPANPNSLFPFFKGNVFWNNIYNYSLFGFPAGTEFKLNDDYDNLIDDSYYSVSLRSIPKYSYDSRNDDNYYIKGSLLSSLNPDENGIYKLKSESSLYQRQEIQNRNIKDEICVDCKKEASKIKKDASLVDEVRLDLIKDKIINDGKVPKKAFLNAWEYFKRNQKNVKNKKYLTVVDYNLPSDRQRLFLINLKNGSVERHMVSHGKNSSGKGALKKYAVNYSNKGSTYKSSHGAFLTGESYTGRFGYSLRVDGQQKPNSNARNRSIVIHPYDRVFSFNAGDTLGCFGLSPNVSEKIINKTKNGSVWYVEPYAG